MRSAFLVLLSSFFFVACSPSSLVVVDKNLVLDRNDAKILLSQNVGEEEFEHYSNLEISKYKLNYEDSIVYFEYLKAEITWEFTYGPVETIQYIFKGSKTNTLYKDSHICLVQLKLEEERYVNVFIESSSFNEMSYAYGFSNESFLKLLDQLNIKHEITQDMMKKEVLISSKEEKPLSKWSMLMLLLKPLLKPADRIAPSF